MIKSKADRPNNGIEIDLTGPEGNAFYLLALAENLSRQLGYDKFRTECILEEMRLTTYEGLLHTFDREFGTLVTMWK
tara:strand:- start:327 stop:557 length:231 start_codon:yes stop_codon:yes gene_type:complete